MSTTFAILSILNPSSCYNISNLCWNCSVAELFCRSWTTRFSPPDPDWFVENVCNSRTERIQKLLLDLWLGTSNIRPTQLVESLLNTWPEGTGNRYRWSQVLSGLGVSMTMPCAGQPLFALTAAAQRLQPKVAISFRGNLRLPTNQTSFFFLALSPGV